MARGMGLRALFDNLLFRNLRRQFGQYDLVSLNLKRYAARRWKQWRSADGVLTTSIGHVTEGVNRDVECSSAFLSACLDGSIFQFAGDLHDLLTASVAVKNRDLLRMCLQKSLPGRAGIDRAG